MTTLWRTPFRGGPLAGEDMTVGAVVPEGETEPRLFQRCHFPIRDGRPLTDEDRAAKRYATHSAIYQLRAKFIPERFFYWQFVALTALDSPEVTE